MLDPEKTTRVLQVIATLVQAEPVFLIHQPEPDAQPNECWDNCQRKVLKDGGTTQTGVIFAGRYHDDYIVAMAHAVWRSPEDFLIDITPRLPTDAMPRAEYVPPICDEDGRLLFVPDDDAFNRPLKYLPLSGNKALVRACRHRNREEWRLRQSPHLIVKRIARLQKQAGWK